jgi:hypothetical protein
MLLRETPDANSHSNTDRPYDGVTGSEEPVRDFDLRLSGDVYAEGHWCNERPPPADDDSDDKPAAHQNRFKHAALFAGPRVGRPDARLTQLL